MFWPKRKHTVTINGEVTNILQQSLEKTKYTPDVTLLEQKQYVNLFVYNEWLSWTPKHMEMVGEYSAMLSPAVYTEKRFTLWKKKLGKESFPVALEAEYHTTPCLPIRGELIAIKPQQLFVLDKDKVNGVEFKRVRIRVHVPYRELQEVYSRESLNSEELTKTIVSLPEEIATVRAFTYIGVPEFWQEQLDGGYLFSPVRKFTPRKSHKPDYYYFSKKELEDF